VKCVSSINTKRLRLWLNTYFIKYVLSLLEYFTALVTTFEAFDSSFLVVFSTSGIASVPVSLSVETSAAVVLWSPLLLSVGWIVNMMVVVVAVVTLRQ